MNRLIAVIVVGVLALLVLNASVIVVGEWEQAVITEFGRPKRVVDQAGLAFRVPFVQEVHRLEKRLLPWDGDPEPMPTKDKKRIFIDVWARWRIVEPMQFFRAVRTVNEGQRKLDDLLDSAARDVVAGYNLIECVRSTNNPLAYEIESFEDDQRREADKIELGRQEMEAKMLSQVTGKLDLKSTYGMEVTDVRIKRVNYVESVRDRVHERMISERTRIAKLFESEAEEERNRILGNTRKELDEIEGDMEQKAAEIRGEADAAVITIYADAVQQSPEFFEFMRRLDAYKATLGDRARLVLSTDNDFLRLMRDSGDAARPDPANSPD